MVIRNKGTKLRVAEALQDDAYRGIARIDFEIMRELDIKRGDVITIKGGRETVAIADKAYPADVGEGVIRIDGIIRKNAKTGVGENIIINKADIREAKKIILAPIQKGIRVQGDLKPGLLGRAIIKGDIVVLGGVQRRRDLMSDDFGDINDIFGNLNEMFGGFGGMQQIRFIITNVNPNMSCIITENTEVILSNKSIEISNETLPEITYEDVGGLTEEVKKVREMVEVPLKHPEIFEKLGIEPPKGVLLHGPPGTGKTLLAKAVANESEANFILLNGPEIMSKFYGESEKKIRDIFEEAEKNSPSIIFIDELDAIAPKREDVGGEVERRVVSQLLTMMDGLQSRGKIVVIGATNRPNALDPALRRPGRFDRELEIRAPDKKGRLQILKIHTRGMPLTKDVDLDKLASVTHGFVGADISSLAKESAMIVLRKLLPKLDLKEKDEIPENVLKELKVCHKDFEEALKVVRPSAMREVLVETPNISWKDIGGLDKIKRELREAVEWPLKYPDSFIKMGIKPPKGILLYGPPGTGKTLLAKAVAKESEANFIQVKGPSLLSMWVGKSEEGVRKIFERARQVSPCVVFFDEIDSLAGKRGLETGTKVTERVLNQLLSEMDGIENLSNVIVIGATNRPDMLDSALLRPGRFDRILLTSSPDLKGRETIFKIHTKNMPIHLTNEEINNLNKIFKNKKIEVVSKKDVIESSNLKNTKRSVFFREISEKDKLIHYLAEKTEGYVGADIESLVREAAMLALREDIKNKSVKMKHFEQAMIKVGASVTKADIDKYRKIETEYLRSAKSALEKSAEYLG